MPIVQPAVAAPRGATAPPTPTDGALSDPLSSGELSDSLAGSSVVQRVVDPSAAPPVDPSGAENRTGLPGPLKSGIESLSGLAMDDVSVHRNSSKPAALHAHAYAAGNDIHLANGREADLPHEAWHVVQQKQGRVAASSQLRGVGVNDSSALEQEADVMGGRAAQAGVSGGQTGALRQASAGPGVAQLRGENPHAKAVDHKGWTTTAHHIVAHSQLGKAFEKLSGPRQIEVLKGAIPDVITKDMVANLKCDIEDSTEARANLQAQLVGDDADTVVVGGAKLGEMRSSFFEWQGGNQFQGPNTSIRAEPGTSKDGMDLDGQYFNGMTSEEFSTLTTVGDALPKLTDSEEDQEAIKTHLLNMLAITKNKPVTAFDDSKWVEVTDPAKVTELASHVGLGRAHIEDYAFLTAPLTELGDGKKYDKVTPALGGEYKYEGLKINNIQVKGTSAYFAIGDAKALAPSAAVVTPLRDLLTQLGVQFTDDGTDITIPPHQQISSPAKNKFSVGTFSDQIPCRMDDQNFKANKKMVDNKKLSVVTTGQSLYTYAVGKGMPSSTYLPKALYDSLT